MARVGQIAPEAQAVNEARDKLASAIDNAFGTGRLAREEFLSALEHFINAKISANSNPRY